MDILLNTIAYKLAFSVLALCLYDALLRYQNKTCGISFARDIMPELRESRGTAMAVYFGSRAIAAALVVSACIG